MINWKNDTTAVMDFGYIRAGDPEKTIAVVEFPELTGSEKQITWARGIRVVKLQEIRDIIERFGTDRVLEQFKVNSMQEAVDFIMAGEKYGWLKTTASAHAVIENRFK